MIGSIIGDIVGSVYEFNKTKQKNLSSSTQMVVIQTTAS